MARMSLPELRAKLIGIPINKRDWYMPYLTRLCCYLENIPRDHSPGWIKARGVSTYAERLDDWRWRFVIETDFTIDHETSPSLAERYRAIDIELVKAIDILRKARGKIGTDETG